MFFYIFKNLPSVKHDVIFKKKKNKKKKKQKFTF